MTILPDNVTYGFVTGRFLVDTGIAAAGKVRFLAAPRRLRNVASTPATMIELDPVVYDLDDDGDLVDVDGTKGVYLVATDNAGIDPIGWTWGVTISLEGEVVTRFDMALPGGSTVDLAHVIPAVSTTGTTPPVIVVEGGGGGGGGGGTVTDVVWVGATAPTDPDIELWWDTDEVVVVSDDVLEEANAYTDAAVDTVLEQANDYTDAATAGLDFVAHRWLLNDEVGTVAADQTGLSNGSYVGNPIKSDTAVTFVGNVAQYVRLPILDYGSSIARSTVSFWINTSESNHAAVFSTRSAADSMVFQLTVNSSNASSGQTGSGRSVLNIRGVGDATTGAHWSCYDIPYDGTFHHVIIAISDDPITVRFWIDGVLGVSTQVGTSPLAAALADFQYDLTLGARNSGSIDVPVEASLRDFTIRPYEVNDAQAQQLYTQVSGQLPKYTRNWSWWTRPRAVSYANKLFVAGSWGQDAGLDIYAADGTRASSWRVARYPFEDHNNGAILIRTGKPMVWLWSRHNDDNFVYHRVGLKNVESAVTREDYIGTTEYTYANSAFTTYNVAMDIGGTIWVLNRVSLQAWKCRSSTAWSTAGVTWGPERDFIKSTDTKQMYTAGVNVGTTIRFACCNHPKNGFPSMQGIYYGEINTATGAITGAGGGALGTLGTEIFHASLQPVYVPAAGLSVWIFDVGDNATTRELVFIEFDINNPDTTGVYKYARWSGSAWVVTNIVASGRRFNDTAPDLEPYFGSLHIRRGTAGGVVYLARESGGVWTIERRTTADSGATWPTTQVLASFTEQPRQNICRPYPVEGDGTHPADVVYVKTHRWTAYTDYRSDFRIVEE